MHKIEQRPVSSFPPKDWRHGGGYSLFAVLAQDFLPRNTPYFSYNLSRGVTWSYYSSLEEFG